MKTSYTFVQCGHKHAVKCFMIQMSQYSVQSKKELYRPPFLLFNLMLVFFRFCFSFL